MAYLSLVRFGSILSFITNIIILIYLNNSMQYITYMNFKTITLLFLIAFTITCIDEFKTKKEKLNCIHTCAAPISACLKETNSTCQRAYTSCHQKDNFLICIESSNSLMMQQIAKCMRSQCKREEQKKSQQQNAVNSQSESQDGNEFVHFRKINLNVAPPLASDIEIRDPVKSQKRGGN